MAIIKCINCGRNISDTEKVCPHCEEKIEKKMSCPKCGAEDLDFSIIGKSNVYMCKSCGNKFRVNKNGEVVEYIGAKKEDYNIFTAYINLFKKMFDFRSRSRRKEYWLGWLSHLIVLYIVYICIGILSFTELPAAVAVLGGVLIVLYTIAVLAGMIAMEIRRLHDTGRDWTSFFVTWIPLVGQYLLLYYMIEDSQFGPNEYGPNPKGLE